MEKLILFLLLGQLFTLLPSNPFSIPIAYACTLFTWWDELYSLLRVMRDSKYRYNIFIKVRDTRIAIWVHISRFDTITPMEQISRIWTIPRALGPCPAQPSLRGLIFELMRCFFDHVKLECLRFERSGRRGDLKLTDPSTLTMMDYVQFGGTAVTSLWWNPRLPEWGTNG